MFWKLSRAGAWESGNANGLQWTVEVGTLPRAGRAGGGNPARQGGNPAAGVRVETRAAGVENLQLQRGARFPRKGGPKHRGTIPRIRLKLAHKPHMVPPRAQPGWTESASVLFRGSITPGCTCTDGGGSSDGTSTSSIRT